MTRGRMYPSERAFRIQDRKAMSEAKVRRLQREACKLSQLFVESYHQSLVPLNGQVIYLACDPASGKTAWCAPYEKGWGGLPHTNTWSQMEVIVLEKIGTQSSSQKLGEFMFILRDWIFSRPGQKQVFQSGICWLKGSEFTKVIHAPQAPSCPPILMSRWEGSYMVGVSSPWLQHKRERRLMW